jgi:hypothetical protein
MATVPSTQKILTSSEAVNTTYGGSQALKELNTWYTMEDISNTVKPYKVFTALLTQNGGDNVFNFGSDSPLPFVIGATYEISQNDDNGDFTNIGAPNNNAGTFFIATGTTPASWGTDPSSGSVSVNSNTGAPVATVLENTIGNIWFSYTDVGFYGGVSEGLFLENKTVIFTGVSSVSSIFQSVWNDENPNNGIFLKTFYSSDFSAGTGSNNVIYNAPIEIRVYN